MQVAGGEHNRDWVQLGSVYSVCLTPFDSTSGLLFAKALVVPARCAFMEREASQRFTELYHTSEVSALLRPKKGKGDHTLALCEDIVKGELLQTTCFTAGVSFSWQAAAR